MCEVGEPPRTDPAGAGEGARGGFISSAAGQADGLNACRVRESTFVSIR
jgi:hypothetical protein